MKRRIVLSVLMFFSTLTPTGRGVPSRKASSAISPAPEPTAQPIVRTENEHEPPPAERFTPRWFASFKVPPNTYWDEVAQCETESNWRDHGNYAGGLGIAYAAWIGFGGEEFADKQWKATRKEQITVANRIAITGYQNKSGDFSFPVGFNGWGCIRNNKYLTPPVGSPWQQAKENK